VPARRLTRLAAAVLLAGTALAVPASAATWSLPAQGAVFVPATGETVTAPLAATRGAIVQVHVSGVFAYDSRGGLADCGSHDVNAALGAQDWQPGGGIGLLVNGAPAGCLGSVAAAQHHYTINLTATGALLRFAIADSTGYADNAGGLTIDYVTAIDVDGSCVATGGGGPQNPIAIVAEAHQTGAYPTGAYTRVECDVYAGGVFVEHVESEEFLPATAVHAVGYAEERTITRCLTVSVLLADRSVLVEHTYPCV
jgi:hypothetical protein